MPLDPSDTPQFYVQELHDALREQSGRIGPFETPEEVSGGASAEATLLEGSTITILLSLRGYTTEGNTRHFETLDDLLCAHSAMWVAHTQEILYRRLQELSDAQAA